MKSNRDKEPIFTDPTEVRIALLRKGLNLQAWAHLRGYLQPTVYYAVTRSHQGRLSIEIRRRLRRELGLGN
jgi:hypothetical protein